jgi:uncharacterized membrane protein
MSDAEYLPAEPENKIAKLPLAAALVALVGLGDAIYLTINHYTGEKVPCSITGGCEAVLTSAYAEIGGVPLAAFGALAYFLAFSLAILAAFGNRLTWKLFGVQATLMAAFSLWLIYLQAFVILEYCQFCLLSAATSVTLFLIALFSRFWRV